MSYVQALRWGPHTLPHLILAASWPSCSPCFCRGRDCGVADEEWLGILGHRVVRFCCFTPSPQERHQVAFQEAPAWAESGIEAVITAVKCSGGVQLLRCREPSWDGHGQFQVLHGSAKTDNHDKSNHELCQSVQGRLWKAESLCLFNVVVCLRACWPWQLSLCLLDVTAFSINRLLPVTTLLLCT